MLCDGPLHNPNISHRSPVIQFVCSSCIATHPNMYLSLSHGKAVELIRIEYTFVIILFIILNNCAKVKGLALSIRQRALCVDHIHTYYDADQGIAYGSAITNMIYPYNNPVVTGHTYNGTNNGANRNTYLASATNGWYLLEDGVTPSNYNRPESIHTRMIIKY